MYAKALPQFRNALLLALAHQVVGLVIYFPLLFVTSKPTIITLASLGMAFDMLLQLVEHPSNHIHPRLKLLQLHRRFVRAPLSTYAAFCRKKQGSGRVRDRGKQRMHLES
jgi:hypothetical protein